MRRIQVVLSLLAIVAGCGEQKASREPPGAAPAAAPRPAPPAAAIPEKDRQKLEELKGVVGEMLDGKPDEKNAGILGSLAGTPGGAFSSLTGTADFSSGVDDPTVYGGLLGNDVGDMQGGWGYGLSGVGPGGGGTGWGTIGTGRYGLIGKWKGKGKGRGAGAPGFRIGSAAVSGDLDKNIIRRYVRRRLPRIQYCYEKQLLADPKLAGTLEVRFQISPAGSVVSASGTGFPDPAVTACVTETIRSIEFPKPKGGGSVDVRYPFTFWPAG